MKEINKIKRTLDEIVALRWNRRTKMKSSQ
jgi:hypothetical protein